MDQPALVVRKMNKRMLHSVDCIILASLSHIFSYIRCKQVYLYKKMIIYIVYIYRIDNFIHKLYARINSA